MNISYLDIRGLRHDICDAYAREQLSKKAGVSKCMSLQDYDASVVGTVDNPGDDWNTMFFLSDIGVAISYVLYNGRKYYFDDDLLVIAGSYGDIDIIFDDSSLERVIKKEWSDPLLRIDVSYKDEIRSYQIKFQDVDESDIPLCVYAPEGGGSVVIDADAAKVFQYAVMEGYNFDGINDYSGLTWSEAITGTYSFEIPGGSCFCIKGTGGMCVSGTGDVYVDGRAWDGLSFKGDFVKCGQDLMKGVSGTVLFSGCKRLLNTPAIESGCAGMFAGCESLNDLPEKLVGAKNMFQGCVGLLTVPMVSADKMEGIACMFKGCKNLRTVKLDVGETGDGIYNVFYDAGGSGVLSINKGVSVDVPDGWTINEY